MSNGKASVAAPAGVFARLQARLAAPLTPGPLSWLLAPDLFSFGYALRTTISSLIALWFALWWELGSPQWACLTVWMIAQGSRGRSIAKARWHMFGMIVGSIAAVAVFAAFPQQPVLLLLGISGGIGLFCFIATFLPGPAAMTNYRMHGMRATGFTYAIITLDLVAQPGDVFMTVMSRATYITLGIIIETVISSLFQFGLDGRARTRLAENFISALEQTCSALVLVLSGRRDAISSSADTFAALAALSDQVEFAEIEMGKHGHEGDHARAALACVAALFSRGLDLETLMTDPLASGPSFQKLCHRVSDFLRGLPARLTPDGDISAVMAELRALNADCHFVSSECLAKEMEIVVSAPVDVQKEMSVAREGQAVHVLGDMLQEVGQALEQFDFSRNSPAADNFRYTMKTWRDWHIATANSLRAAVSIFVAGVIWICTAWPDGLSFLMFTGIICALFSTLETPALASRAFFHGAVCVSVVCMVVDFLVVPPIASYEFLAFALMIPMMVGGLAFANPKMILGAVAYNLFLPILLGPLNQGRMQELMFFNTAMPLILAMAFCTLMYQVFLPLDPDGVRWGMRTSILSSLRGSVTSRHAPIRSDVIGHNIERMVRLLNTVGGRRDPVINAYLRGILSGMTIELNLLHLRSILREGGMPQDATREVQAMMDRMAHFSGRYGGHYGRTERASRLAVDYLVKREQTERNLSQRIAMLRALASLRVICAEISENRLFFDASSPYLNPQFP
ncbi:FUSC family protein [Acetobacter sp. AN02]|uniref:FUSC family protein n=1 Tax=Acetobacter sp. AN02 TaxID=2894186 RepID=UPI0024345992|nr:FUSC family protein [Acetobacter sp. AN02]MDG6095486.1 FUSC family protein [Acetobacter sp. AN02]